MDSLGQELSFSGPQGGAARAERADRPVFAGADCLPALALDVEAVRTLLNSGLEKLFQARKHRPKPHLDSKMLAAWNGEVVCLRPDPYIEFPFPRALICQAPGEYYFSLSGLLSLIYK